MGILVIFTGGTIGSSVTDGYISPNDGNKSKLINMYKEREDANQEFEETTPYTVLSENLGGEYITRLIHCLNENLMSEKYDGIVVTHGTDTLQYTAAALGIVFEDVKVPVMLVSSNYPLEDSRANGYDNFRVAVEYIKNGGAPGVYAPYRNTGGEMQIFPANAMLKYDIYSDKIRMLPDWESRKDINEKLKIDPAKVNLNGMSPIKFITPYPGIRYDIPDSDTKAVIFGSYHSGTIQTSRKELIDFCEEMKSRGIPMYLCGAPEGTGYESTKYYEEMGIEVLPYGTDVYWYIKLWIMNSLEE